jgi:hypothetical protein
VNRMKEDTGAKIAIGIAMLALAVALIFMFVIPKPTTRGMQAKQNRTASDILKDVSKAHEGLDASQKLVTGRTWTKGIQQVGPGALQEMNALALKHQVKLSGFRPERTSQYAGLDLVPFSVTAEGSYLDVLGFVKAIEDPSNKLAVNLVQIASSEANGDQVTATVGLTAYHVTEVQKHA